MDISIRKKFYFSAIFVSETVQAIRNYSLNQFTYFKLLMYSNIRSGHFLVDESVKCTVGLKFFLFSHATIAR